jgi:site-specific DNA recombinase
MRSEWRKAYLEQSFNSLHAQRKTAESFIQSQRREGWIAVPECYDDGGFTGASIDRPALQRLLAALEAGELDCVVVYKVDRLSRSPLDFTRTLSQFEKHEVSFVRQSETGARFRKPAWTLTHPCS